MHAISHLWRLDLPTLESRFGRHGVRLYELARVNPHGGASMTLSSIELQ